MPVSKLNPASQLLFVLLAMANAAFGQPGEAVLTALGAAELYHECIPAKVQAAIDHELPLIEQLGYAPYFLTVHDIVRFARSRACATIALTSLGKQLPPNPQPGDRNLAIGAVRRSPASVPSAPQVPARIRAEEPPGRGFIPAPMAGALTGISPSWNATPSIMMFANCLLPSRCSQISAPAPTS